MPGSYPTDEGGLGGGLGADGWWLHLGPGTWVLVGRGCRCLRSGVKVRVLSAGALRHILTENETLVVIEVILLVLQLGKQIQKGEELCLSP